MLVITQTDAALEDCFKPALEQMKLYYPEETELIKQAEEICFTMEANIVWIAEMKFEHQEWYEILEKMENKLSSRFSHLEFGYFNPRSYGWFFATIL